VIEAGAEGIFLLGAGIEKIGMDAVFSDTDFRLTPLFTMGAMTAGVLVADTAVRVTVHTCGTVAEGQ
jgi:hypothetical protein